MSHSSRPVPTFELAPGVTVGGGSLPVILGPCVLEGRDAALEAAQAVAAIASRLELRALFKASFDKANRSSIRSFRGPGLAEGLRLLRDIHRETGLEILTDVHEPHQCEPAAEVCAVLQIPAFLCRQTDLITAAAATGRPINIKKGQFLAPDDLRLVVDKARATGNERITVTERGTTFGYHNLVVDMRSFAWMQSEGIPVIYDVTHSLQLPGGAGEQTGGERRFAGVLARAAVAAGADGLFLEVHPRPSEALSDRATQLDPLHAERLLVALLALHAATGAHPPREDIPS